MRKFIRSTCIIICIVIVISVIYSNNLTIEQKIGRNQEDVLGYKKRDVSNLEKYAIQEGFEYMEYEAGYQFNNFLLKKYNRVGSICETKKKSMIYDGSPYKIMYSCIASDGTYTFVYDFKNNSWYTNENRSDEEKDFIYDDFEWIKLPNEEQEIFNQEFKEIHEDIKKGVENFKEE